MAKKNRIMARRKKGAPEIPVNSFADIAFLLIVFFIVASTLTRTTGIMTDIPAGQKSDSEETKTAVVKLENRRITFNDSEVTVTDLRKRLADLKFAEKESDDDKVVLLEARGNVDYQTYYGAMSAISGAGGVIAIVKEGDE